MPRYNPIRRSNPSGNTIGRASSTFATPRLPAGRKALRARHVSLSQRRRAARRPSRRATPPPTSSAAIERMRGKCVLHPMGWDAFGLPAEQYAKKTGTPPRMTTEKNIDTFRRQIKMLGFSYDWDRELATTDRRLLPLDAVDLSASLRYLVRRRAEQRAGRSPSCRFRRRRPPRATTPSAAIRTSIGWPISREAPVNWCPRAGHRAGQRRSDRRPERARQPSGRAHAAAAMDAADHGLCRPAGKRSDGSTGPTASRRCSATGSAAAPEPRSIFSSAQRTPGGKPIRRSSKPGATTVPPAGFPAMPGDDVLRVFTTRPDTLFGATYMVVAPEHPLVARLTTPAQADGGASLLRAGRAQKRPGPHRTGQGKDRRLHRLVCANPGQQSARADLGRRLRAGQLRHRRDHGRAGPRHARLRVRPAVRAWPSCRSSIPATASTRPCATTCWPARAVFTEHGTAINSGPYDGQPTAEFKKKITADLARPGLGRAAVNYKLRDWLFSRQHFWGEPFPILHELGRRRQADRPGPHRAAGASCRSICRRSTTFKSHGSPDPPLEQAPDDWLYPTIDGRRYKRETNTMPQWAGSCWYYLRFLDPKNEQAFVDPAIEKAWMPVDLYVGGAEHAVLHLLYARFWHKVLFDRGHVSTPEPFRKLVNQGMILGEMEITGYQQADGSWVSARAGRRPTPRASRSSKRPASRSTSVQRAAEQAAKARRRLRAGGRSDDPARQPGAQNVEKPRQRRQSRRRGRANTVPTRCGCTRCSWARSKRPSPGAWKASAACAVFLDRVWRMIVDERSETLELNPAVQDVAPTVEQRPRAAPHDPGRDARHRADVVQHGHRQDDGVHQLLHQVRRPAARGDGTAGAAAFALRPAPGRGAVAAAGPRQDAGLRALADVRPRRCAKTRSRSRCRSTASCAAGDRARRPPRRRAGSGRGPIRGSPSCWSARRSLKSCHSRPDGQLRGEISQRGNPQRGLDFSPAR